MRHWRPHNRHTPFNPPTAWAAAREERPIAADVLVTPAASAAAAWIDRDGVEGTGGLMGSSGFLRGAAMWSLAVFAAASSAHGQCSAAWATHLPTARIDADMAYDTQRQRVVLFGGVNGTEYRGDTWEFDGQAWRLAATNGPSPRRGHKMVYDPGRRRTLLIGGYSPSGSSPTETWAWDGATWRLIDSGGPGYNYTIAAQNEHAAAFDQSRNRLVVVLAIGQTWEFSGEPGGWQQASTSGPSARRGMAMGYDRLRGRVIYFGGTIGAARQADTWEWDGVQWRDMGISGPSARTEARMAYDSVDNRLLLYGGSGLSSVRVRDTWALSGTTWTQILSTGPMTSSGATGNAIVYMPAGRRLMLLGGNTAPWTDITTLEMGTSVWQPAEFGPAARTGAAAAYDQVRGQGVLFGGLGTSRFGDTWVFDGGGWSRAATAGPSPRNESAMAYDPVRQRIVLFGGNTGAVNGETWEWDGASWSLRGSTGPSPRDRHAMCWDPNLGGVILHGGAVSGGAASNETWLWNGSAWTRVGTGPTRSGHAMAYFPPLGRVVLYGGSGAGVTQNAFAWDGSSWTQIGTTGPNPATEHSLVYDPDSARLVLVGATTSDAAAWLFDGAAWQRVPHQANTVRARTNLAAWHDAGRDRIMLHGGSVSGVSSRETWEYRGVGGPVLSSTPTWQVLCRSGEAVFTVNLAEGAIANRVTWLRNGFTIITGPTAWGSNASTTTSGDGRTHTLRLTGLTEADAGGYQCVLENTCGGATVTNPAFLRVCIADFNCSGSGAGDGVSTQDIFDFLAAWFAGDERADVNRDGMPSVQDLFDFLAAYFAGC